MEQDPLLQTKRTVRPIRPEAVSRPRLPTASINPIAAVPDRTVLVLNDSPMEAIACLRNPSAGQVTRRLEHHANGIDIATLSPDGEWGAAASDDQPAGLWPAARVSPG